MGKTNETVKLPSILSDSAAVITKTVHMFSQHECSARAAALAYHLLFSLFPLLLFLVFLGGQFLQGANVKEALFPYLETVMPAIAANVERIVEQTLEARGSIGIVGGLLLLWSASGVFSVLTAALNTVWEAPARPYWRRRMISVLAVILAGILFVATIPLSTLTSWVRGQSNGSVNHLLGVIIDILVLTMLFWAMYRILPNKRVDPRTSLVGAGVAACVWKLAQVGMVRYLSSGLTNYGLVYGSLASVVVLMIWSFLSGTILLYGASLAVVLEREAQKEDEASA
ncbi:MAG: YihY/virulence factor BrkB family protein [Anaerolineales bacterium]|nr:YihY/virulence factor BrkB family protein [Anaerolineales bacterium]